MKKMIPEWYGLQRVDFIWLQKFAPVSSLSTMIRIIIVSTHSFSVLRLHWGEEIQEW